MKVITLTVQQMEMENIYIQMEQYIKEIGKMMSSMDLENYLGLMCNILVNLRMDREMGLEFLNMLKEAMKVSLNKIR